MTFEVLFDDNRCTTADTLDKARRVGHERAKNDEVYGIKCPKGRPKFYMRRGSASYPISLRAAANEVAMRR